MTYPTAAGLLHKALTEIEHVDYNADRGRHSAAHTIGAAQCYIELALEALDQQGDEA